MLSLQCSSRHHHHQPPRRQKLDMNRRPCIPVSATVAAFICFLQLLFPAAKSQSQNMKTDRYVFGPFDVSYYTTFKVIPPASINFGALQVTPDTAGNVNLTDTYGRILFRKPFNLWEDTGKVASFNSSFLINVYRVNNATPGEGVAFFIASSLDIPRNSHGQYLGLTNSTTDGNPDNHIVAVELDTVKQDFDPDDNHIGLNINSVKSKTTVSLSQYGMEIAPKGAKYYVIWIDYNGSSKEINVFIKEQPDRNAPIVSKPEEPVLTSDLDLKNIVKQSSYFGFSASTGTTYQLNCVLRWNLTVEILSENKNKSRSLKMGLGIGVPLTALILVGIGGSVYCVYKKKRRRRLDDEQILGTLKSLPGTPREYSFKELKKATNNFSEKNKLGEGGYGMVYRGILQKENNLEVAVKKFCRDKMKCKDDFLAELTIINRLRHKHLVRLLGWCHKNGVLILVYEFMPNGSLDNHLFFEDGKITRPLSWNLRYKIISGVASALNYLHNEYDQKVVHRDLKASNIMLDSDFNARLGDFGLARAIEHEKTSYAEVEGIHGTMGYIAPECFHTGKATRQSDVFSFGAVLLEVVCGERPWTKKEGFQLLVDWVWYLYGEGRILEAVDKGLGNEYEIEEAEKILKLGLACSHPIAGERPKMQTIMQIISGAVPVPYVPPSKPAFIWPAVDFGSFISDLTTPSSTTANTPVHTDSDPLHSSK
ncbi:probable L-type lectin-domain containing receptor kinase S.5 [Neltuma alba]|uniref:probable L-type lectin-domain containing receptor kinase S.5 n=1 Tax=Neltuma alba TaxID=207710 RepID=UPI0010A4AD71|nr:probable L-type lectin-domain containing receptor kinase S.5 [Prosopis alba]XP_028782943.1 probable L-type lectin-domain containing receptor kinase S.5 [Prosopis alba]